MIHPCLFKWQLFPRNTYFYNEKPYVFKLSFDNKSWIWIKAISLSIERSNQLFSQAWIFPLALNGLALEKGGVQAN